MTKVEMLANPTVMTTRQAADFVGLAKSTLEKMRIFGGGPKFLKLKRAVRNLRADREAWLSERLFASTSEADSA